jgi:hypothetical protein
MRTRWASPGADVDESWRRCGRVPAQMWASPGADVAGSDAPAVQLAASASPSSLASAVCGLAERDSRGHWAHICTGTFPHLRRDFCPHLRPGLAPLLVPRLARIRNALAAGGARALHRLPPRATRNRYRCIHATCNGRLRPRASTALCRRGSRTATTPSRCEASDCPRSSRACAESAERLPPVSPSQVWEYCVAPVAL